MDLARVDLATNEIASAFNLYLAALTGRYLTVRAAMAPGAAQHAELQRGAFPFGRTFLDIAKQTLVGYALRSPDGADAFLANAVDERSAELVGFFKAAVTQTIKEAERLLTTGALSTRMHGALGQLQQLQALQPQFKLPDAAGRMWDAYVLVKSNVRDAFYQSEVDAAIDNITVASQLARVLYPGHDVNGLVVRVAGQGDFTALDSVRAEIFHPNSGATLEAYHRV